jgi:pimeloyl-ACP methyl ester carboxylesterase
MTLMLSRPIALVGALNRAAVVVAFTFGGINVPLAAQSVGVHVGDSARVVVAPSGRLTVPVSVDLSTAGALNLASLQAGVTWGASQLTFDSIRVAPSSGFTLTPNPANAASGSVSFNAFSARALAASGPLATAYFTAGATSGGTRVALTPTVAATDMAQDLLMQFAVRNVDVCVANSGRWGDVTDDGTVNIVDAQQIARSTVGLSVANPTALAARGDVTGDGTVNIIDAQQIARFTVALSAAVRVNAQWLSVAPVTTVAVAPAGDTLVVGQAMGLAAALQDSTQASVAGCYPVTWTSSDTTVAKVSSAGLVTGIGPGTATITAASGGKSATATVTAFALGSSTQVGTAGGVVQATGSGATLTVPAGALTSGSLLVQLKDSIGYPGVDRPLADRAYLLSITPIGNPTWSAGQNVALTLPITQAPVAGQTAVVSVVVAGDTMWFPASVMTTAASAARVARPSLRSAAPTVARSAPVSAAWTPQFVLTTNVPLAGFGAMAGTTPVVAHWMSSSDATCPISQYPSAKGIPWTPDPLIGDDLRHHPQQTPISGNVQVVLVEGINLNVGDCADFTRNGTRTEDYFAKLAPVLQSALGSAYPLWAFTYPTSNHLSSSGQALAADLEALAATYPLSDVVIVAHSMGGLVSRLAAAQLSSTAKGRLKGIITLGTPHLGAPLAALGNDLAAEVWPLGLVGVKPSWGLYDLYAGVPDQLTKEAPLYAYGGDISTRSFGSMPAAWLDAELWMLRLDACGVSYSPCHSDGIVPVSSATPAFMSHRYPAYSYDHMELVNGSVFNGSASDPLYLSIIADIKSAAPAPPAASLFFQGEVAPANLTHCGSNFYFSANWNSIVPMFIRTVGGDGVELGQIKTGMIGHLGGGSVDKIVCDAESVYWAGNGGEGTSETTGWGKILEGSAGGQPATVVADGLFLSGQRGTDAWYPFAYDGQFFYITARSDATSTDWAIRSIPKAGGQPTPLVAVHDIAAFTLANGFIYYEDWDERAIKRIPASGGTSVTIVSAVDVNNGPIYAFDILRVVGTDLYWTEGTTGAIKRAPAAGGGATTLLASGLFVYDMQSDGSSMFVWIAPTIYNAVSEIRKYTLLGFTQQAFAGASTNSANGMALDGAAVYTFWPVSRSPDATVYGLWRIPF